MNLEDTYYFFQILASLAVIGSLLFLSYQLKEGNRQQKMAALQASISFGMNVGTRFSEHPELWEKVVSGKEIESGPQLRLAILLFNLLISEGEIRFYQNQEGYLSDQGWGTYVSSLSRAIKLPIFKHWRQSIGAMNHGVEFTHFLDQLSAKQAKNN